MTDVTQEDINAILEATETMKRQTQMIVSLSTENVRLRAALAEASSSLCTAYCSHNAITGELIQHRVQCTRLTAALQGE